MGLITLNEVYDEWATGDGVFTDLDEFDVPWKSDDTTLTPALNMAYHGSHSGDKNISPIIYKFLKSEDENTRSKLAKIIYTMYGDKWSHLWDLMQLEYNPIENYNMTENETPAETTHTITPAETTETVTPAETTETITPAETTTETKPPRVINEEKISAFNSSDYVDRTLNTSEGDESAKGTESIDVDTAGTNKFEVDVAGTNKVEVDEAGTDVFTVQNARELTRSGNIGVTTSQQMAQSEIELRKWLYYESVFNDIDNILTLSIY